MAAPSAPDSLSPLRLRTGIIMFALWWIPVWLLAPVLVEVLGVGTIAQATIAVALVQTIIGLAGVVIAGKQILAIMRGTSRRDVPKKVWHIFWKGTIE